MHFIENQVLLRHFKKKTTVKRNLPEAEIAESNPRIKTKYWFKHFKLQSSTAVETRRNAISNVPLNFVSRLDIQKTVYVFYYIVNEICIQSTKKSRPKQAQPHLSKDLWFHGQYACYQIMWNHHTLQVSMNAHNNILFLYLPSTSLAGAQRCFKSSLIRISHISLYLHVVNII